MDTAPAFFTSPFYAIGTDVGGGQLRINETATRARAGLLNAMSAATVFILLGAPQIDIVIYVGPIVIYDMIVAALFGLTPLSPFGLLGTALTMKFPAAWKPPSPKRFAWTLGAGMGITCTLMRIFRVPNEYIAIVVLMCYILTWLEACLGFCVGCWMYGLIWGCDDCIDKEGCHTPTTSQRNSSVVNSNSNGDEEEG